MARLVRTVCGARAGSTKPPTVSVSVSPTATSPSSQKPPVHAIVPAPLRTPVITTWLTPGGITSTTLAECARDGPLLLTTTVQVMRVPAVTVTGPLLRRPRSASLMTTVRAVSMLLARLTSGVALVTRPTNSSCVPGSMSGLV